MEFVTVPTQQTTAITDAILGLLALSATVYLLSLRRHNPWKIGIWAAATGCLALASLLGAIVHGVKMSVATSQLIWKPLYLALAITVALFVAGAVYDRWGREASRRALVPVMAVGVVVFGLTVAFLGPFQIFLAYEGLAMLFALWIYGYLALHHRMSGAWLMTSGIVVTLCAGLLQVSSLKLTLVWPFDHNGLFHLLQMPGVLALVAGVRRSVRRARRPASPAWSALVLRPSAPGTEPAAAEVTIRERPADGADNTASRLPLPASLTRTRT